MYNEENLYSVISLVVIHILNFQLDLIVMRFIGIELIICSTSKVDRVKVHIHVVCDVGVCRALLIVMFCLFELCLASNGVT